MFTPSRTILFAALLLLAPQELTAEISGSGHQIHGCDSQLEVNYFVDLDGNGTKDNSEIGLSEVTVSISRVSDPELGSDTLQTDHNGNARFSNLCEDDYLIETDLQSLPANSELDQSLFIEESDEDAESIETEVVGTNMKTVAEVDDDEAEPEVLYSFENSACDLVSLSTGCSAIAANNVPASANYSCDDPYSELTMIWNGTESVRVLVHRGKLDDPVIADIDNIAPGDEVEVGNLEGAESDIIWEIFAAGTNTKLGESSFHLKCSEHDIDGPEDCGLPVGDGKNNDKCTGGEGACMDDWIFEGLVDKSGSINCTQDYPTEVMEGSGSVCTVDSTGNTNFQYRLDNFGPETIEVLSITDSELGVLAESGGSQINTGASQTYSYSDVNADSGVRTITANVQAGNSECQLESQVQTQVDEAESVCSSLLVYLDSMSHDALKLKVSNYSEQDVVLTGLSIAWPEEHENLKEAKFSGDKFAQGLFPWSPATQITEVMMISDVDKRTLESGKQETVEIKFEKHVHNSPQLYDTTVEFENECLLQFQNNFN